MTKEEAIQVLNKRPMIAPSKSNRQKMFEEAIDLAIESLSAEPKWITDRKPKEDGAYMVTLDAFGHHRFVEIFIYGKPIMPNRKVRGKCWYRSDDEWGDVVYDDSEILAWMPLPKPYREEREVEE